MGAYKRCCDCNLRDGCVCGEKRVSVRDIVSLNVGEAECKPCQIS